MSNNTQIIKDSHISEIMKYLHNGVVIPEDMMYSFYLKTIAIMQGKIGKPSVSERAKDFCLYMSRLWSSKSYSKIDCDPIFIFQLGELHTCARILEDYFAKIEEENDIEINSKIETDSKRFFTKLSFFEIVMENPGIKHSVLSDEIGISKSSLSQFVAKIKEYGYYSERIAGREKYYYLTDIGVKLLERMRQEANKPLRKGMSVSNRATTYSFSSGISSTIYPDVTSLGKETNNSHFIYYSSKSTPHIFSNPKKMDIESLYIHYEPTCSLAVIDDGEDKFESVNNLNDTNNELPKPLTGANMISEDYSDDYFIKAKKDNELLCALN